MKLIKPSFEIIEQQTGNDGMLKQIELAGRTAYKSEDKITDDSAVKFVKMLEGLAHGSVLEHGTVYLKYPLTDSLVDCVKHIGCPFLNKYIKNKYTKVIDGENGQYGYTCITTNYRVLVENNWLEDLKYQCEPTEFHEKRITVKFVCDRGVSHEFVRHRVMSITQESTRYCNYSKDKFGNDLTFIAPLWIDDLQLGSLSSEHLLENINLIPEKQIFTDSESREIIYLQSLAYSELSYLDLLKQGWKPQQARSVLPNSLKTEVVMTGFISDWKHFFKLRTSPQAHPQAIELAKPLEDEFKKINFI